jgi:hypothetical protein
MRECVVHCIGKACSQCYTINHASSKLPKVFWQIIKPVRLYLEDRTGMCSKILNVGPLGNWGGTTWVVGMIRTAESKTAHPRYL